MSEKIIDFSNYPLNVNSIQELFGNSLLDDQKNGIRHFILDFSNATMDPGLAEIGMKLTMLGGLVDLEGGKCILISPKGGMLREYAPMFLKVIPSCTLVENLTEAKNLL